MFRLVDTLVSDFRHGARMLGTNPGFTATVVLILALGIGANSAVFSVVNAVLLRPLPYAGAGRIYELQGHAESHPQWISAPDFLTWKGRTTAFETMAAASQERYVLTAAAVPEQVDGLGASRELLPCWVWHRKSGGHSRTMTTARGAADRANQRQTVEKAVWRRPESPRVGPSC